MSIFQTILAAKTIYTLGIVNLVTGLMVFFTCRCLPGYPWPSPHSTRSPLARVQTTY